MDVPDHVKRYSARPGGRCWVSGLTSTRGKLLLEISSRTLCPLGRPANDSRRWVDMTWERFEPDRGRTMVFDNNCRMMDDPESEVRKILLS